MRKHIASRRPSFVLEGLEGRQLLSGSALPWGAYPLMIGQAQAYADYPYLDGSGQTVAVIDQGVDYNHIMLGGGIGPGYKVIAGANFGNGNPSDPMDTEGHGTGVSGIIAANPYIYNGLYYQGIADHANIVALRETNSNQVKSALDWVIANHARYNITVINMTDFVGAGFSPTVYQSELKTLYRLGIFMVTPVGNGGVNTPIALPAASPYVYGAGAVDLNDVVWQANAQSGTELGSQLDVLAPGVNVTTTAYDVAHNRATYVDYATGTSFASPHIAGAALLLRQLDPDITPAQIISIIEQSGTPVVAQDGQTYPRLNVDAAIALAYKELDQGNNNLRDATRLTFTGGVASATNQKLLIGREDDYLFTLSSASNVAINLQYGGTSAAPSAALLNASGDPLFTIGANFAEPLNAGTYYVHLTSPQSLEGTFGLTVNNGAAAAPTPRRKHRPPHVHAPLPAAGKATAMLVWPTTPTAVQTSGGISSLLSSDGDVLTGAVSTGSALGGIFTAR